MRTEEESSKFIMTLIIVSIQAVNQVVNGESGVAAQLRVEKAFK